MANAKLISELQFEFLHGTLNNSIEDAKKILAAYQEAEKDENFSNLPVKTKKHFACVITSATRFIETAEQVLREETEKINNIGILNA